MLKTQEVEVTEDGTEISTTLAEMDEVESVECVHEGEDEEETKIPTSGIQLVKVEASDQERTNFES